MSADNWAICPRCLDQATADANARFQAAAEAYGKVDATEYERLRTEAQVPVDPEEFRTFREDYEFYDAATGTVQVSYSGHCQKCKLDVDFKTEREFYVRAAGGGDT